VLGAAQHEHLERLFSPGVDLAGEVVQLRGLPAARALDPLPAPPQPGTPPYPVDADDSNIPKEFTELTDQDPAGVVLV
jgi:hypothetical protein